MVKILVLLSVFLVSACAQQKVVDLKSPCVSSNKGPCVRTPVNDWFLKELQNQHKVERA